MVNRMSPRSLVAKLIMTGALVTSMFLLYTWSSPSFRLNFRFPHIPLFSERIRASCSPKAWADGHWTYRPIPGTENMTMTKPDDSLKFSGLGGCAADREYNWHLGSDREEMWDRFPAVTSYVWSPAEGCDVRPLDGAAFTQDLVEKGGWLLLGDSITENQFFSLSCLLYPHVRATPNYTENPYFDRAWPQHLYLSPTSPLIPHLAFPANFSIENTPLVTFRRVDLLLTQKELVDLHVELHPEMYEKNASFTLFSEEQSWNLSPKEYIPLLLSSGPEAHYTTLVASTAGHWTTTLFEGYRDESLGDEHGFGIEGLLEFFQEAMQHWAWEVQTLLDGSVGEKRQVVIRAYLPGHEDCHAKREPWTVYEDFTWNWYNWPWIRDFNRIFEGVLSSPAYPDVHFLPIDRPALLRPDAHASGDCLHLLTGSGVLEGWSHYTWHYVTRELPGKIR